MADFFRINIGQGIQSATGVWYKCVQALGAGGNANTYLVSANSGEHRGVLFALKVFRRLSKPERREAFLNEVSFLAQCSHPSVMRVFDSGSFRAGDGENVYPFVVAEYLPNTLAEVIRARTATIPERISYSAQLVSALAYLAARTPPVLHRDIKPQNIFLKGHSCVLGDFGLMKVLDGTIVEDKEVLKESIGPGMPFYYRTPDLVAYARNEANLTPKSDVFQLGLVLSELFTGRNPCIPAENILADVELEPLGHVPGDLGAGIAGLLKRMLVMSSTERRGAAELMDGWLGTFERAVEQATRLEGRVF
ncbi:protein kinase family protein [Sorangium sp. So ce388]|uniref:protein kinase family protein n=1 Tax=Sorangium sp. So ce388 TaxID=3133309 RepID=UPI003F5C678F